MEGTEATGRRVRLRLLLPNDYEWLYPLALDENTGYRWRFRGAIPSPEAFVAGIWESSFVQFVIEKLDDGTPLGLIQAYNADLVDRHVKIALLISPGAQRQGWPMEGAVLMLRYLFRNWPLNKIYIEGPEPNLVALGNDPDGLIVEEGRLTEHTYFRSELVDWVVLAVHRREFDRRWEERLAWLVGQADRPNLVRNLSDSRVD
jgi:hypothetical protein